MSIQLKRNGVIWVANTLGDTWSTSINGGPIIGRFHLEVEIDREYDHSWDGYNISVDAMIYKRTKKNKYHKFVDRLLVENIDEDDTGPDVFQKAFEWCESRITGILNTPASEAGENK